MTYQYRFREHTLEELAACVISSAAAFAESCVRHGPIPQGPERRSFARMVDRLEGGDVLDERDDACIAAVGQALVDAANSHCPGYGNRVLNIDTNEDVLVDRELERLRDRILAWDGFRFQRNRLRARIEARQLLGSVD